MEKMGFQPPKFAKTKSGGLFKTFSWGSKKKGTISEEAEIPGYFSKQSSKGSDYSKFTNAVSDSEEETEDKTYFQKKPGKKEAFQKPSGLNPHISARASSNNEEYEDKSYFSKHAAPEMSSDRWDRNNDLHRACASGDLDSVHSLLTFGTPVNGEDEDHWTPLHHAANHGHTRVVSYLLSAGADINAVNWDGDTPLHKAATWNHADVMQILVSAGADVNAQNESGWTALHEAVSNNRKEVVQLLLHYGANVNAKTKDGDTPLHKAARWNREELVKLLLLVGADVNARDAHGRTAADRTGDPEIVYILEQAAHGHMPTPPEPTGGERPNREKKPSGSGADAAPKADSARPAAARTRKEYTASAKLADLRESYEMRWLQFSTAPADRPIAFSDIPWPSVSATATDVQAVILYGAGSESERKKRLRAELLRWHPDKFTARFGLRLVAADRERALARVIETSQVINSLMQG